MAAVISNQGGYYSSFAYVSEARRLGVAILGPDVNQSEIRWKGKEKSMRVGLLSISGLSRATREKIMEKRKTSPYQSLKDFLNRVRPETSEANHLIHAGAFDALHPCESRATLLWELAIWQKNRLPKTDLFSSVHPSERPDFPNDSEKSRLRNTYVALGFLCDRHPMVLFSETLKNKGIIKAENLHRYAGKPVQTAGLLITGKVVHTKHGEPMEFLTFEDETGLMETVFFPEAYRRFCTILDKSRPVVLSGKVEEEFGAATLTVNRVSALPKTE
jgi:DNA polymerase-3 subunit alpha/error-prone DNA polymerase